MLLVCLSHLTYLPHASFATLAGALERAAMIASPTFVLISGLATGVLAVVQAKSFDALERKLRDRAAFLLVVAHPVLAAASMLRGTSWHASLTNCYVTDAIAIALIVGPRLAARTSAATRLLIAAATYLAAVAVNLVWHPSGFGALLAKMYLVGSFNPERIAFSVTVFAIVPWTAVYIAGTALGSHAGGMLVRREPQRAARLLAASGALALGGAAAIKLGLLATKAAGVSLGVLAGSLYWLVSPYAKFPPGPFYLAVFGGAGLLMLGGVVALGQRAEVERLFVPLRTLGRASLVVFVAQAFLYGALSRWAPERLVLWPAIYLATITILWGVADLWDRHVGNRWLGVRAIGAALVPERFRPAIAPPG